MSTIKILAVEDDLVYAETLKQVIIELEYELVGIAENALTAIQLFDEKSPDVILMDMEIKGAVNGMELASRISSNHRIPIIFISSFNENDTLAQASLPKTFIFRPYDSASLQSAIELAIFNEPAPNSAAVQREAMGDTFYIKDNHRIVKIRLRDILVVEGDDKYCYVTTTEQQRLVVNMTKEDLLDKLPHEDFIQVHRSFVVRKSAIGVINVGDQTIRVADKTIPVGKAYKEHLLMTFNYLT